MNKQNIIERVFTINYKVKDFFDIQNSIDLFILGIANIRDDDGWTALMWASKENYLEVVQELIKAGADVNIQDNDGLTALIWASRENHLKVVQALINAGADLNIKNNEGETALMWAYDNLKITQTLIKAGADVNIQNNEGWTALIYAKIYKNQEIIDILKKAGAK